MKYITSEYIQVLNKGSSIAYDHLFRSWISLKYEIWFKKVHGAYINKDEITVRSSIIYFIVLCQTISWFYVKRRHRNLLCDRSFGFPHFSFAMPCLSVFQNNRLIMVFQNNRNSLYFLVAWPWHTSHNLVHLILVRGLKGMLSYVYSIFTPFFETQSMCSKILSRNQNHGKWEDTCMWVLHTWTVQAWWPVWASWDPEQKKYSQFWGSRHQKRESPNILEGERETETETRRVRASSVFGTS